MCLINDRHSESHMDSFVFLPQMKITNQITERKYTHKKERNGSDIMYYIILPYKSKRHMLIFVYHHHFKRTWTLK